jgi:hypothetical protein
MKYKINPIMKNIDYKKKEQSYESIKQKNYYIKAPVYQTLWIYKRPRSISGLSELTTKKEVNGYEYSTIY